MQSIHAAERIRQSPPGSWAQLPEHIRTTLEAEGVHDLTDWSRLGRKRFRIFGVTRAMVVLLDAAARGRL